MSRHQGDTFVMLAAMIAHADGVMQNQVMQSQ